MSKKELDIEEVKKKIKKRFNIMGELELLIDSSKMLMFTHKASRVVIVASKDSGKSYPVELYKIYCMERDNYASGLTLMKYSTGAGKRGARSFWKSYTELQQTYDFPHAYENSTGFMYRMKDKRKRLKNQSIEYGSFENSDSLAGYTISNGGYPAFLHIEEPVLQGDANIPTKKQWDADYKTILDTIKRHHRTYRQRNSLKERYHEPIPFKTFITMNDWAPDHPISVETERFFPQAGFLNWILDFDYISLQKLWRDKIDGESVVPELKAAIDSRWEEIKEGVLVRHTKWRYVDYDKNGIKIDTLFGRMQKFANPSVRDDDEARQEIYDEMYHALITGNTLGLAKAFGMGFGGTDSDDLRFNFKSFRPKDTDKLIKEPGRETLGFSIGWDHDANRGPVGTPVTFSGKRAPYNHFTGEGGGMGDYKIMIHPQIIIPGYGKGVNGQNTAMYHEQMIAASKASYDKYVKYKQLPYGANAVFDDDDGSYVSKMSYNLLPYGYDWVDSLENKNGKIESGGFGVSSRDDHWGTHVDLGNMIIDEGNEMLVEWLKQVPRTESMNGDVKRSVKGKWGTRMKDISNSAEYGWWPFRFHMLNLDRS